MPTTLSKHILLVEDNPGDVRLVQEAFYERENRPTLHVAKDGVEALEYLTSEAESESYPAFILLDLNLPRKNGHEVLSEIKRHPRLKQIPVIVLTSSRADNDIARAYELCANCYIVKPLDLEQFLETVHQTVTYWCEVVSLPANRPAQN
jgi:two-component system, chemotaxis family, response regulator Rcp1